MISCTYISWRVCRLGLLWSAQGFCNWLCSVLGRCLSSLTDDLHSTHRRISRRKSCPAQNIHSIVWDSLFWYICIPYTPLRRASHFQRGLGIITSFIVIFCAWKNGGEWLHRGQMRWGARRDLDVCSCRVSSLSHSGWAEDWGERPLSPFREVCPANESKA